MTRKVIQISASSTPGLEGVHPDMFDVVALCDDGTMWEYCRPHRDPKWVRIPDVPQDEDSKP